jgi:hypothetical protein
VSAATGSTVNLSVSISSLYSCSNQTVAWSKLPYNDESYYSYTSICTDSSSCSFSSTGLNGYGIKATVTPKYGSAVSKNWVLAVGDTPGAPTGLSASSGTGQASLTWSAPASNGGKNITNYYYQYSSDNGSNWSTATLTGSTATSKTVTGLTNGTSYIFRVAAVNTIGTGSYSSNSASVTPQGISITAQPVGGLDYCGNGLSVTASGATGLSYQWQYYDSAYSSWENIYSATSATLPASNGTLQDWAKYGTTETVRVVVSKSGLSSATSNSVTYQPRRETITVTQSPAYSVNASPGTTINLSVSISSPHSCTNQTVAWSKLPYNDESYYSYTSICTDSSSCSFSSTGLNGYGIKATVTPKYGSAVSKNWVLNVR